MQGIGNAVLFFQVTSVGLLKIRGTTIASNELVAFVVVEVSGLLNERRFKFLLVDSLGSVANFNEHLNRFLNVDAFNELPVSLFFHFDKEKTDQLLFDLLVLNNMSFELSRLHSLD